MEVATPCTRAGFAVLKTSCRCLVCALTPMDGGRSKEACVSSCGSGYSQASYLSIHSLPLVVKTELQDTV